MRAAFGVPAGVGCEPAQGVVAAAMTDPAPRNVDAGHSRTVMTLRERSELGARVADASPTTTASHATDAVPSAEAMVRLANTPDAAA
jgi:hypothetical protein